jgi:glutaredoxin
MTVEVVLYTGAGCGLCGEALRVLELQREPLGFELRVVDITGDAELEGRYREQIPVVEVNGRKAFKYQVDPAELRRRVLAASQTGH